MAATIGAVEHEGRVEFRIFDDGVRVGSVWVQYEGPRAGINWTGGQPRSTEVAEAFSRAINRAISCVQIRETHELRREIFGEVN